MFPKVLIILTLLYYLAVDGISNVVQYKPCEGYDEVSLQYEQGSGKWYRLLVTGQYGVLPEGSRVHLEFDTEATVAMSDASAATIALIPGAFQLSFVKTVPFINILVYGPENGPIPYIKGIYINTIPFCRNPRTGYLDSEWSSRNRDQVNNINQQNNQSSVSAFPNAPENSCGRRKVEHTELIVSGSPTKPGDWPWHVALYRFTGSSLHYICGGTLISKTLVLTAAHCVTLRGAPVFTNTINVILGKFYLTGGDISSEERQVHEIVVHPTFDHWLLNNDIALLRLRSEAVYNDYIQPACLWHSDDSEKLPPGLVHGTVVGWGFDHTDTLASQLRQAKMPKVSESTCLKTNPVFFSRMLNDQKFCAGYQNGTSACNGDSGGGFHVFVPDTSEDAVANAGTWHVRGIVSTSVARLDAPICDPTHFVLFTDVAKYKDWIANYMN